MKITLYIPDQLLAAFDEFCGLVPRSSMLQKMIQEVVGKSTGPISTSSSEETTPVDDWGNPVKKAVEKTKKVVKQIRVSGMCRHLIALSGYCKQCSDAV